MPLELIAGEKLDDFLSRVDTQSAEYAAQLRAILADIAGRPKHEQAEQAYLDSFGNKPDLTERHEQSPLSKADVRIDRNAGMLFGVRVMGQKSAHGYEYSLDAQRAACSRYEQMPVGLDHDYAGGPMTVEAAWGTLCNPRVDERGTVADLRYLKSHVRTEQVLEDAERDVGLFSLSAVTTRVIEKPKGTVTSFSPVRVDLVVRGATTRKLFEQKPSAEVVENINAADCKALWREIDELKARQLKYEQFIEPKPAVATAVAEVAKTLDLTRFWND